VTTADVTGATTVYFTPYKGNVISLYDGAKWTPTVFTELSQATTDTTKSPAAVANNSNYDVFVWNDAGTLRATRGPAWSSDTARGAGAGTTELEVLAGRYVNKIAITNGPAAQRGLYVGTIRSNGSAQINDSEALRCVWNNFNRVKRAMKKIDTTDSWTYNTAAYRYSNNNAANRLDLVRGLDEDSVHVTASSQMANSVGSVPCLNAVGLDSSTAVATGCIRVQTDSENSAGFSSSMRSSWNGTPGLGFHFLAWIENGNGAGGTSTWIGDNGTVTRQSGIETEVMA